MINPVRLGAYSHNLHQKPPASDSISEDEYDSADDLEGTVAEDITISNKIPDSRINFNSNRLPLTTQTQAQDSPLKEKVNNNYNQARNQAYDEQTEAIKNLIYNKSPKEAADEYLAMSRQMQQPQFKSQSNKPTNSPLKAKNHPKSITIAAATAYNKENIRQEENEEPNVEDDSKMMAGGEYTEVSAYTELANKIFVDKFYSNSQLRPTNVTPGANANLLLSVADAQKIEEKRYLASKEQQEDMVNRLMKQGEAMHENSKALTSAYLSKELQECTFAPRVYSAKPRRTLDQFLRDQQEHLLQKEEKTRRLQEEKSRNAQAQEETTFKPSICQGSKKILEKKQRNKTQENKPAHQRLHHVGKNAQTKQMQAAAQRDTTSLPRDSVDSHFVGGLHSRVPTSSSQAQSRKTAKTTQAPPTFKPQIHKKSKNLKRDDRVDNILYNDALRRQHKVIEASKMKSRSTSLPGMSFASKRALAMRFIKEFDIAILEFLEVGKEPKLTYLELLELLRKLCFIKESEQMESTNLTPEKILAYDMWYTLHADKHSGVHRRNLLVFLLGILNLHFPITKIQTHADGQEEKEDEPKDNEEEEEIQNPLIDEFKNPILPDETNPPYDRKSIGEVDDDGNFELNEEDVGKLHKIYNLWYINRMCSGDNLGQLFSTRNQQEFSYHPEINAASQKMAQNYRERILEDTAELIQQNKLAAPKDGKLTHVDLLIVSKKVTEEKVNKYGELLKEEKARQYTYKPRTVKYDPSLSASVLRSEQDIDDLESRKTNTRKMNPMPSESMGSNRVFELYSLAKPQILKTDKDKLEVDYEKNIAECTFQPTLYTNKQANFAAEPKEFYAKGIEKNIERMRLARLEKEHQQKQLERGFSTGNEGHFVFATDNRKFTNNTLSSIDRRSNYRGTTTSGYRENSESIQERVGMDYAQQMRGDEGDRANYYTYEQQMQEYGAPTYGIEGEEGLGEVQEVDNEHENAEEQYEEEDQDQENPEEEEQEEEDNEDEDNQDEPSSQRVPLLFVDVNLGQGKAERIVVYEGDRSDDLAQRFADEHGLDVGMRGRLKELLDSQIDGLLSRIDEELNSGLSETERQQHSEQYAHEQIQEEDDYAEEGSYRM